MAVTDHQKKKNKSKQHQLQKTNTTKKSYQNTPKKEKHIKNHDPLKELSQKHCNPQQIRIQN